MDTKSLDLFQKAIQTRAFVKFGASWCTPCKKFRPVYQEIKARNPAIHFLEVDVEADKGIMKWLKSRQPDVVTVPTIFVFSKGKYRGSVQTCTAEGLKQAATQYFSLPLTVYPQDDTPQRSKK